MRAVGRPVRAARCPPPPQPPRAYNRGRRQLLRVQEGGIERRRRVDHARPDVRPRPCGPGAARPRVLRGCRHRGPARRRAIHALPRGTERERSHVLCRRAAHRRRLRAADPAPPRHGRATRCCSASRSRPSPSPASPPSRGVVGDRRAGRAGVRRRLVVRRVCWPSSGRSRAGSTRRWRCRAARSSVEPAAGHSVHARTHVHYETGDHAAGRDWLDGWIRGRRPDRRQPRPLLVARRAARAVDGRLRRRPGPVCRRARAPDRRGLSRAGRLVLAAVALGDHPGCGDVPDDAVGDCGPSRPTCSTLRRRRSWRCTRR